jgi:coiled-coil-helix-coiled-coil-helix domain-containing protein 2
MMAQMAATAGSVAIGSTIGHGLSNMLFGGSSSHSEAPAPVAAAPVDQQSTMQQGRGMSCEVQAKGTFVMLNV